MLSSLSDGITVDVSKMKTAFHNLVPLGAKREDQRVEKRTGCKQECSSELLLDASGACVYIFIRTGSPHSQTRLYCVFDTRPGSKCILGDWNVCICICTSSQREIFPRERTRLCMKYLTLVLGNAMRCEEECRLGENAEGRLSRLGF